ncbi:Virginiamycin B lyase [bacterium HR30]|nr:Virginiamycin B lyase [bacterium HR30]
MSRGLWRIAEVMLVSGLLWWAGPSVACTGDCNADGNVTVDEILRGVNAALELPGGTLEQCPSFDRNLDGSVTIEEILRSVAIALTTCPAPVIRTIAGNGMAGYDGDGRDPLATAFYLPQDLTVGPDRLLYLVDWNNHRLRRIRNGVVETIAGTGELGDAQDGDALYTKFNHPTNVAFDRQGRLLVAAWHNSLVKRLDFATGRVENVAGTGARAFGGDGGPANEAKLDLPSSIACDSKGNILVSDQANYRIRLIDPDGIIRTICGTSEGYSGDGGPAILAQLRAPRGQSAPPAGRIAIDALDQIYIADTGNHVIRFIDTDGIIHTIAGTAGKPGYSGDGGPATQAQLNTPSDVAVARDGSVYVADTMNSVIRRIRPDGVIETVAGTGEQGFAGDGGPATSARLDRPYGVEVAPNGHVFIADTHNHRFRVVGDVGEELAPPPTPTPTPTIVPCSEEVGLICTYAGNGGAGFSPDGTHRLAATLYWPFDIAFLPNGRKVFLDWNNHLVREILPDDTIRTIVGTDFVGDGPDDLSDLTEEGADPFTVSLNHPTDVEMFPNGDILFHAWHNHKLRVVDRNTGRVRVLTGQEAAFAGDGGPVKVARLNQPPHGVFDAQGNYFFIDQRNQRIRVIYRFAEERENAVIDTVVGNGTAGFADGPLATALVNFPTGPNPEPSGGITVDRLGNLYFADTLNHRIRRVQFCSPDFKCGVVTTIAGTGVPGYSGDGGIATEAQLNFPQDLELGPDGNLYFADTNNNVVRMIDLSTGLIRTVVGTGTKGYAGDGGPALAAQLNRPFGIAFDERGDLYVSDTFNGRIRKIKR